MSWVRRHPFAATIFGLILLLFVLVATFGSEDEERWDVILGLAIIYLLLVGVYALVAWLFGLIFGRSKPKIPVSPMPYPAQQQYPQWDWAARTAMPSSVAPQAPVSVTCRQCGATNPPDAAFCDQCGARLTIPVPPSFAPGAMPVAPPMPTAEDAVECPRCRTKQSPRVRFCTNCGLPRSTV